MTSWHRIWTPWSRFSADRAFSGDTWSARSPSATIASGSRCGGRNWPGICSRSAGSARSTPCRPICATRPRSRPRCAIPHVAINLVGILAESGAQTLRCGAGRRRRARSPRRQPPSARGWSMSRRSAPTRIRRRVMPAPRPRAKRRCWRPCPRHHPAALGRVRPRGRVHQPLRGAGADVAGAAADRRRADQDCSRSMSAMSRPRSRTPSTARPGRARRTNSAARKC